MIIKNQRVFIIEITLVSRFIDSRTAGIGNYSKLIYNGLKNKKNLNINLLTQENSILPFYNSISYFFYAQIELKFLLMKDKFKNSDVQHALSPMESFHINKRKGVTSILDVSPVPMSKYSLTENIIDKSLKEAVKSERIIVINANLTERLEKQYNINQDSVEVIGPSISSEFHPINKKNEDKFIIGTISRLDKRKRIDYLIKSFLEADIKNSELLIAGKGPELNKLKKLAKNDKRIKFLGFISDNKVNNFYNLLDVFVFPSKFEGYGMPMVEAMGCLKPVITLNDSDIPSIVKNKTFITEKENLAEILKNREYECNLKKNMEFYKNHSIDKRASQILKVYESI